MFESIAGLLPSCSPEAAWQGLSVGLLFGLFLAGAAGSAVHCGPMCGGFVVSQVSDRMAHIPAPKICEWRRLRAGLVAPYHLGRLTTYTLLGALAASTTAALGGIPWFAWLSAALMVAAAGAFLWQALTFSGLSGGWTPTVPPAWSRLLVRPVRRLRGMGASGGYLLGLVLGLLPCSFLYGALFAAASTGDAFHGALAMACFALGTMPMLMLLGVTGHAATRRWPRVWTVAMPLLSIWNAAMLLGAAGLRILV